VKNIWQKMKKPIIGMAPMDGVTDASFRQILAIHGKPDLMITEFTSVEGICHDAVKTLRAFIFEKNERPILAQLFGSTPENFYRSCFLVAELGFDGIDINMGCPSKSVYLKGAGAGLIQTPRLAQEIIRSCQQAASDWNNGKTAKQAGLPEGVLHFLKQHKPARAVRKKLPVSVKTRIGYNQNTAIEWLKVLLECRPDAISLHGRTLKQLYSGSADWETIGKAAEVVHQAKCLILGNGDITNLEDALKKIETYNLDGVLIGRAALGNPWIFTGREADYKTRLKTALEHSRLYEKIYGKEHFVPMRKHLGWYCKSFPHAAETRIKLMNANSADDVAKIVKEIK
jgi:nifR3 family TIM-barrel protein